jgi:lipopolysaccharide biosynthesis regulator YciM
MRSALHCVLAGDLGAAEQELAEAARLDSSSSDVYLALANLYRARGEIGRAIQIHQNLLLRPDLPDSLRREALLALALDFRAGGFLVRARASFEELLEHDPGHEAALRELEHIHVESGEWADAIQVRRRIGRRDSHTPRIVAHLWTGLGRTQAQAGKSSDARRSFRRALSRDSGCAEAYVALGDLRLQEGNARKAIGLWSRALPLHPSLGVLVYPRLWEAHTRLDDLSSLERFLRERLEEEPSDREAAIWLARAIVKQGRVDDAIDALRRILDQDPGDLPARAETGRILLSDRREFEALKAFEELLDRLPLERQRLRCQSCGTQDATLHFRCPQCGEWDSFG